MRQRTIERFEEWKAEVNVPAMLFSRIAEGETLPDICKSQEIPYSLAWRWIATTPALKVQYDSALQAWADRLAQETVGIADAVEGSDEASHVTAAKLRVDTRLKIAGKWDRDRYGERDAGGVKIEISLGNVAAEIAALEQRLGMRTIDVLPEPVPAAVTLTAQARPPI